MKTNKMGAKKIRGEKNFRKNSAIFCCCEMTDEEKWRGGESKRKS